MPQEVGAGGRHSKQGSGPASAGTPPGHGRPTPWREWPTVAVYCRRRPPYVLRIRETFKGYEAGTVPAGEFLAFIVQLRGEIQAPCAARPST